MQTKSFLVVTALGEGATSLALLAAPPAVLSLLLGISQPSAEALVTARIAGAALAALGLTCWLAQNDESASLQTGVLFGMLLYDAVAALVLALSGIRWNMAGIGLWPAVALHSLLGLWCLLCLATRTRRSAATHPSGAV